MKKEEKGKVGRPKLADKELIKKASFLVGASIICIVILTIIGINVLTNPTDKMQAKVHLVNNGGSGTYCYVDNSNNSDMIIIGDSRMLDLCASPKKYKASYITLVSGSYINNTYRIDSNARLKRIKNYIDKTVKKHGGARVYVVSTINDNYYSIDKQINGQLNLVKKLKKYNNKISIYATGLIKTRDEKNGRYIKYNNALKNKASKSNGEYKYLYITPKHLNFTSDGDHFVSSSSTNKEIYTKMKNASRYNTASSKTSNKTTATTAKNSQKKNKATTAKKNTKKNKATTNNKKKNNATKKKTTTEGYSKNPATTGTVTSKTIETYSIVNPGTEPNECKINLLDVKDSKITYQVECQANARPEKVVLNNNSKNKIILKGLNNYKGYLKTHTYTLEEKEKLDSNSKLVLYYKKTLRNGEDIVKSKEYTKNIYVDGKLELDAKTTRINNSLQPKNKCTVSVSNVRTSSFKWKINCDEGSRPLSIRLVKLKGTSNGTQIKSLTKAHSYKYGQNLSAISRTYVKKGKDYALVLYFATKEKDYYRTAVTFTTPKTNPSTTTAKTSTTTEKSTTQKSTTTTTTANKSVTSSNIETYGIVNPGGEPNECKINLLDVKDLKITYQISCKANARPEKVVLTNNSKSKTILKGFGNEKGYLKTHTYTLKTNEKLYKNAKLKLYYKRTLRSGKSDDARIYYKSIYVDGKLALDEKTKRIDNSLQPNNKCTVSVSDVKEDSFNWSVNCDEGSRPISVRIVKLKGTSNGEQVKSLVDSSSYKYGAKLTNTSVVSLEKGKKYALVLYFATKEKDYYRTTASFTISVSRPSTTVNTSKDSVSAKVKTSTPKNKDCEFTYYLTENNSSVLKYKVKCSNGAKISDTRYKIGNGKFVSRDKDKRTVSEGSIKFKKSRIGQKITLRVYYNNNKEYTFISTILGSYYELHEQ